eukprot:jgi/Mesvir1/26856/Mv20604-RA.1
MLAARPESAVKVETPQGMLRACTTAPCREIYTLTGSAAPVRHDYPVPEHCLVLGRRLPASFPSPPRCPSIPPFCHPCLYRAPIRASGMADAASPGGAPPLTPQGGARRHRVTPPWVRDLRRRFMDTVVEPVGVLLQDDITRRLLITLGLLTLFRFGSFVPIPGYERRFVPENHILQINGVLEGLADTSGATSDLVLNLFTLGISPYICASFLLQFLMLLDPYHRQLRKDGNTRALKASMSRLATAFSFVLAVFTVWTARPFALYSSFGHALFTVLLLAGGACTISWISELISDHGLGQGGTMLIAVSLVNSYISALERLSVEIAAGMVPLSTVPLLLLVTTVTVMGGVVLTEAVHRVPMVYFRNPATPQKRRVEPKVDQYIPFRIVPGGMAPILYSSITLNMFSVTAHPAVARWVPPALQFNPADSPVLYHTFYLLLVFVMNMLDLENNPAEVASSMNKMDARVPGVRPGVSTVKYLSSVQLSARFWGGVAITILAGATAAMEHACRKYLHVNIGFTSLLIIVGLIAKVRIQLEAYQQLPQMKKVISNLSDV